MSDLPFTMTAEAREYIDRLLINMQRETKYLKLVKVISLAYSATWWDKSGKIGGYRHPHLGFGWHRLEDLGDNYVELDLVGITVRAHKSTLEFLRGKLIELTETADHHAILAIKDDNAPTYWQALVEGQAPLPFKRGPRMNPNWLAERMNHIEASGIRKVFELARSLKDPVNLSIGQPHFDVPEVAKAAAIRAIAEGKNGYTVTQGIPELREKIMADVRKELGHADRQLMITSGTSGGLVVALCCTVNPGDEVIVFDPYFVMYPHIVTLAGGTTVYVDTYPDFGIDVDRVKAAITSRTKAIIVNSPANPTGAVIPRGVIRDLANLAAQRGVLLISDEIYRAFCYDVAFTSPAEFNEDVLVLDGFSKAFSMTGWRLGFAHGPKQLIDVMTTLQQFTFVCAPNMVQHAGIAAWGMDLGSYFAEYKRKRDRLADGLKGYVDFVKPGGAFYFFVRSPHGAATDFVTRCIENNLLVIPGKTFSRQDTHVRISYAAEDAVIDRGIEILRRLNKAG